MKNTNYNYKNARDASWQTLLNHNITKLPVNVVKIATDLGIDVLKNSSTNILSENEVGATFLIEDKFIIIYDDTIKSVGRKRFTIAHELGHILLGHVTPNELYARNSYKNSSSIEKDADTFASRLLAPACVLWGLNATSYKDIAKFCDVSLEMATIRAKRFETLRGRNMFLTSSLEKQVYKQFEQYILDNRI